MRIDQQRGAEIGVLRVAGEVDFHDGIAREGIDIICRGVNHVVRADMDVVDVEQQPATAAARQFPQKIGFAPIVTVEFQVMRWVFNGDATLQCILRARNVVGDARQCFGAAREGQQVGVVGAAPG